MNDDDKIELGFSPEINKMLEGGWRVGELMVLSVPPKPTQFKTSLLWRAAQEAGMTVRVSLEMGRSGHYEGRNAQAAARRQDRVEELSHQKRPVSAAVAMWEMEARARALMGPLHVKPEYRTMLDDIESMLKK